jgi:Tfp pilus assembly protein PilN
VRAVNLMPRDARGASAAGGSAGSGAGVYVLLAGLAALVACAALWTIAGNQIGDRHASLERVDAEIAAAQKRVAAAAPYVAFQRLARDRVQTVLTLSQTRFDWAHAMHETSRVLPADVWLTNMAGASGASDEAPTTATSAAPAPTITLQGCTRSQAKVARLMARLRTIDGVRQVALRSSAKPDAKGDDTCPADRESDPRFTIDVSFAVPGAPPDGVDATGQVTASAPSSGSVSGASAAATAAAPSSVQSVASAVTDTKDG